MGNTESSPTPPPSIDEKRFELEKERQQADIAESIKQSERLEAQDRRQIKVEKVRQENEKARLENQKLQHDAELAQRKMELQARTVRDQKQHELDLKEIELKNIKITNERDDKMATLKQVNEDKKQLYIESTLSNYTKDISNYQRDKEYAINKKAELTGIITNIEGLKVTNDANIIEFIKTRDSKLESIKLQLTEAKQKFTDNDREVRAVINKTCVNSAHVGDFLSLTANLIPITMQTAQQTNNLGACFDTFHELISRECSDDMPIIGYLETKNLQRFVPTLKDNELYILEDLECDDEEEFQEDIINVLNTAIENAIKQKEIDQKENPLAKDMTKKEKRKLKKICTESETWKEFQKFKGALNKKILLKSSPPMIKYFERTHNALVQVGRLLEIGYKYNAEQQLALQEHAQKQLTLPSNQAPVKAIKAKPNEINDDGKYDENDVKQGLEQEHPAKEIDQTLENTVAKVKYSNKELHGVIEDNKIIDSFAIGEINVIATMKEDFKISDKAKTFAMNIEDTCGKLVRAQCTLRGNVAMALAITKLKPAFMTDEAKVLWKAVDNGCIGIFESALEIIKVTAKYFAFFLRFKDSFGRYLEAMEMDVNCPFVVSLEYLRKDLRDFKAFKDMYDSRLDQMNKAAMKCIKDCVTNSIGGQNFEATQKNWKKSQEDYIEWQQKYQKAEKEVDVLLDNLHNKNNKYAAEIAKNTILLKNAEDVITSLTEKMIKLDLKKDGLQNQKDQLCSSNNNSQKEEKE